MRLLASEFRRARQSWGDPDGLDNFVGHAILLDIDRPSYRNHQDLTNFAARPRASTD